MKSGCRSDGVGHIWRDLIVLALGAFGSYVFGFAFYDRYWAWRDCLNGGEAPHCYLSDAHDASEVGMIWFVPAAMFSLHTLIGIVLVARSLWVFYACGARQTGDTIDFADVTSEKKIASLCVRGKLVKILLVPTAMGGQWIPGNVVYVPLDVLKIKRGIDKKLSCLAADGSINKLIVDPEYKGESLIPSRIKVLAWHADKKFQHDPVIEIW